MANLAPPGASASAVAPRSSFVTTSSPARQSDPPPPPPMLLLQPEIPACSSAAFLLPPAPSLSSSQMKAFRSWLAEAKRCCNCCSSSSPVASKYSRPETAASWPSSLATCRQEAGLPVPLGWLLLRRKTSTCGGELHGSGGSRPALEQPDFNSLTSLLLPPMASSFPSELTAQQ